MFVKKQYLVGGVNINRDSFLPSKGPPLIRSSNPLKGPPLKSKLLKGPPAISTSTGTPHSISSIDTPTHYPLGAAYFPETEQLNKGLKQSDFGTIPAAVRLESDLGDETDDEWVPEPSNDSDYDDDESDNLSIPVDAVPNLSNEDKSLPSPYGSSQTYIPERSQSVTNMFGGFSFTSSKLNRLFQEFIGKTGKSLSVRPFNI